jgi:pilus assembly protein Flp/PilA
MIDSPMGRERFVSRRGSLSLAHLTKDLCMRKLINRFRRDEEGAALVEYGMLVGLIAVLCLGGVTLLGQEISTAISTYAAALAVI